MHSRLFYLSFDFEDLINPHYKALLVQLKDALNEKDLVKQRQCLLKVNSGPYWEKFH